VISRKSLRRPLGIQPTPFPQITDQGGAPKGPPRNHGVVKESCEVRPIVAWAFYGFVFSTLWEWPNRPIPVEIPTLTGCIFLVVVAIAQPQLCFRRPPRALYAFLAYVCVFAALSFFTRHHPDEAHRELYLLIQIVFFFWIGYNLMRYERVAMLALLALVLSAATLATLQRLGIASTYYYDHRVGNRLAVLGQNPNDFAANMTLGMIALIGLFLSRHKLTPLYRSLLIPLGALIGLSILTTGSRGGVIALGGGIVAIMLGGKTLWLRIRNMLVALAAIALLLVAIDTVPVLRNRYGSTVEEGNMSGRQDIFPACWQMFLEKPLTGWGPNDNRWEIGKRAPVIREKHPEGDRDAHNVFLEILTAEGLAGAVPFLTFILFCAASAFRARGSTRGMAPLCMVVTVILIDMSGNWLAAKLDYLMLAYAVASASPITGLGLRRLRIVRRAPLVRFSNAAAVVVPESVQLEMREA
jgi:O-antigen ligase